MDMVTVITLAAKSAGVPAGLLLAVCTTETHLRNVISQHDGHSASIGVCQVKLATARMFSKRVTQYQLWDPRANARFAALYLAKQLKRYPSIECAVTAYNRGSVDIKISTCNTKYSSKVMKALKEESWKKLKTQGRVKRHHHIPQTK